MTRSNELIIFGEVLFDCFPTGETVLGGAPFNVAWHCQAFGSRPRLISRVGDDAHGKTILAAMQTWGMNTAAIQTDPMHPTGRVAVTLVENEPQYDIVPECAYDFIDADKIESAGTGGILYHGTLGLRHGASRAAFERLTQNPELSIFLDVNLRSPWWRQAEVCHWLKQARWVKLNQDELCQLGFFAGNVRDALAAMLEQFQLEQVILTRGEQGATVMTADGECRSIAPEQAPVVVDTVGAGDAFSAVYVHGLSSGWSISRTLAAAQRFASQVVGMRGGTTTDPTFYQAFSDNAG